MAVVVVLTFSCNDSSDIFYSGLLLWHRKLAKVLKYFWGDSKFCDADVSHCV